MSKASLVNTTKEAAIKVMCVANEYSWLKANNLTLVKQKIYEEQNKYIDELICTNGEKEISLFFDITGFYKRSPGLVFKGKDLPIPNNVYNAVEYFELGDIMDITKFSKNILETTLVFQRWSSEQLSKFIYLPYDREKNSILATPVRDYYTETIPLLHGFHFLRLMFIHKFTHINDSYDEAGTVIEPKAGHMPVMGKECCEFNLLEPYNYLNDLLNYTFLTHKPDAFYKVEEVQALLNSLQYGLAAKMFTKEEVESALIDVDLTDEFMETLITNL